MWVLRTLRDAFAGRACSRIDEIQKAEASGLRGAELGEPSIALKRSLECPLLVDSCPMRSPQSAAVQLRGAPVRRIRAEAIGPQLTAVGRALEDADPARSGPTSMSGRRHSE